MIRLSREGHYTLQETINQTKILVLDGADAFAWINVEDIGEILVFSDNPHQPGPLQAQGKYRLYLVKDEPQLTDLPHLELAVGNGAWQGYLLPTGLPTKTDKRNRIIPTKERIPTRKKTHEKP